MPKAPLIRADTIDLQDQLSPSAQDHSRQPSAPGALGEGPPAPHQAASLRHASMDESSLVGRSPRASQDLSGKELQLLHEIHSDIDEQDAAEIEASLGISRNGEQAGQGHGHDGEEDEEDEEGMDDDMMDKISSSPSIDDGGYPQPQWDGDSQRPSTPSAAVFPSAHINHLSSSPYVETPEHLPLAFPTREEAESQQHHHHIQSMPGEFPRTPEPEDFSDGSASDSPRPCELDLPLCDDSHDLSGYAESDSDVYDEAYESEVDRRLLAIASSQCDSSSDSEDDTSMEDIAAQSYRALPGFVGQLQCLNDDDDAAAADDDSDDASDDDACVDSGYEDECSLNSEDIDFEFVYALHTFVATVEGQANATKGDTMVLLDDSNSYWWLVRVVKDSSIGYLPAEHIETPTERLARLNKHRNIDLSQTMLGDNPEKSRNPLKKAMRRRNVKQVTFTDPTYYEPEPEDYSTDEDNDEEPEFITPADAAPDDQQQGQQQANRGQDAQQSQQAQAEPAKVEPLRVRGVNQREQQADPAVNGINGDDSQLKADPRIDRPRASEESIDSSDGGTTKSNRRMRNTDSFYKDESIETRKISLTPNLLRDDSGGRGTVEDARASLEGSEKQGSVEKPKDDKKKEKKQSKFSGFFKRKNSKSKHTEEEPEEWVRQDSQPSSRGSPQPKQSQDSLQTDQQAASSPQKAQPSRQSSKLQKSNKAGSLRKSGSREEQNLQRASTIEQPANAPKLDGSAGGSESNPFDDSAAYESGEQQPQRPQVKVRSAENSANNSRVTSPTSESIRHVFNPVRDAFRNSPPSAPANEAKIEKVKKAKARMALEDSDSEADGHDAAASFPAAPTRQPPEAKDRLSESPVHVTPPVQATQAPGLVPDTSSQSTNAVSPVSPSSSPELVERPTDMPPAQLAATKAEPTMGAATSAATRAAAAAAAATASASTAGLSGWPVSNGTSHPRAITPPFQLGAPAPPNAVHLNSDAASASNTPVSMSSTTRSRAPEWSDALLKNYMDSCGDEFREMLAIVYAPASKDPPAVNRDDPLWKRHEETVQRCDVLQKKLDRLLLEFCKSRGMDF